MLRMSDPAGRFSTCRQRRETPSAVRSDPYFDLVSTTTRVRRKVAGTAEGVSRRCLHLLNLPAGSDIRNLRQQLARMERRLNQLSHDVAELDEDGSGSDER